MRAILLTIICALALCRTNPGHAQSYQVTVFNMANTPVFTTNIFKAATAGKNNDIWVGSTNQGLYRFNGTTWYKATILMNHNIRGLYRSPIDSAIWVAQSGSSGSTATNGGINRIADTAYSHTYYGSVLGAPTRFANGIVVDENNIAWSAHGPHLTGSTTTGGGIGKFITGASNGSAIYAGLPTGSYAADRRVLCIGKGTQEMWVGVDRSCSGVCKRSYIARYTADGVFIDSITASNSPIPFSSQVGGVAARAIHFDVRNRVWVGLSSGGVAVFQNGIWTMLNENNIPFPAGAAVNVQSITEDNFGWIYIGTTAGLLIYKDMGPLDDSAGYTLIDQSHGLPSNNITGIAIGRVNITYARYPVYLTTSAGIARLEPNSELTVVHRKFKYSGLVTPQITRRDIMWGLSGIKIACDGTQSTLFRYDRPGLANCVFRVVEDPQETETEIYGLFIQQPSTGDSCVAIYQHPAYLEPSLMVDPALGIIHIEVYNTLEGEVVETFPVELVRPSVLMIHGLWSSGEEAFRLLKLYLLQQDMYMYSDITLVNYPNDVPFASNVNQIINELKVRLHQDFWERGISSGKVDIVAHSMGGVLSRLYLQHPLYNHDINKLITLNTPHSGSQIANFLLSPGVVPASLRKALGTMGKNTGNGAVADLMVNSDAIDILLNGNPGENLNRNTAPAHTIFTSETIGFPIVAALKMLVTRKWEGFVAQTIARTFGQYYLTNNIYDGFANDYIVPTNSQIGGLTGGRRSYFTDQWHSSTANEDVMDRVRELLNISRMNTLVFEWDGYDPDQILYFPPASPALPPSVQGNPQVTITSPAAGTVVNPLDTLSISITGNNEVSSLLVAAGNNLLPMHTAYYDTTSCSFTYEVPAEAIGKVSITVMGFGVGENIALDSTFILVQPDAVLDSITVDPDTITFAVFDQTMAMVSGHYQDSIVRNLSGNPAVSLKLSTGNAVLSGDNTIFGMAEGIDTLTVEFQGKTRIVPVSVSAPDSGSAILPMNLNVSGSRGSGSPDVCYNASGTITLAGNNKGYLLASGASASFIAGQKISFLPGVKALSGSNLTARIAVNGQYCSINSLFAPDWPVMSLPVAELMSDDAIKSTYLTDQSLSASDEGIFRVYPNPTSGKFSITEINPGTQTRKFLEVYNIHGAMLLRDKWEDRPDHSLSLQGYPSGLYFIRIVSGETVRMIRIVKR